MTFTGWTVSGGEYTTTGGLADIALNINFSETAEYTLAANFLLPDGTSYARQKTVDVKSLTITGSDPAIINTASVYNIPTLPSGITFNGWNISPNSGYVASGTTGDTLDIRFISTGIYTISAYFTLPDGIPCSVSKTISAKKRLKIVKGTGVRKLNSAIIRGYGAGSKGLYFTDTGIREEFLASDNGTHSFYYLPREYIQMIADVVLSYPYYTDSSELRYGLATPEIEYLDIY